MEWLDAVLLQPLTETYFQKALIGGSVVAIVCGVVGCLVILRRMAFLGDALSHAMIAGVGAGYLFMKLVFGVEAHAPAMLLGSLIAAVLTVGLIGLVTKSTRIKDDTAIGIMYVGIFAAGVVLISVFRNAIHIDIVHFIMGDVLGVADADLWVAAFVAAFVLSVIFLFFRHLQITSFDPVMAASIGVPVLFINYLLTTCVSLVVVSAVTMVGVILVVGLLITPAATAYLLSDRLDRMMLLAALFGVTSVVGGLYVSIWLDSAGGGAIMLFCTAQFLTVFFLAPRYGVLSNVLRRMRMVPQQAIEDVLGSLARRDELAASRSEIEPHVSLSGVSFSKVVRTMERDELLTAKGRTLSLTLKGAQQARGILRAHRIWETYLESLGEASDDLHNRAHELEHVRDEEAIAYLDHILGHPDTDPHGTEIPSVADMASRKAIYSISELRAGSAATVEKVKTPGTGLSEGDKIQLIEKSNEPKAWVLKREGEPEKTLDHEQVDSIFVRLDHYSGT
ncbi:MAG: iron chelate uptake ABC transporter family permease subunit [Planctomycetota bacterium]|nr:iron chelate uptake ABC transporter family permease subunit [Planctomycetota bacterium]